MSIRLLILGASGSLGYPLMVAARHRWPEGVHGTYRTLPAPLHAIPGLHRIELNEPHALASLLDRLRPQTVINCAGIVKAACRDPYPAIIVNAAAPHLLADLLRPWRGRLIQISTDCVFSGQRGAYSECDVPDPVDLYGYTKLLGEVVRAPHLTVRTSFIGFEFVASNGLLTWFLNQRGTVQGFRKAIWSGLTAEHLAQTLLDLAERRDVTGLLHVAGDAIDKHTLLRLLSEAFGRKDLTIQAVDEPRLDRSLDASRLRQLGIQVAPVAKMVQDLYRWGADQGHFAKEGRYPRTGEDPQ